MQFRNHTPFPALAFEGIDQHDRAFHVLVLRQTLSFSSGVLEYADEQAPLCEVDTFFGDMNASSVRQESDLCQYKPRCDVIVNATAYAPKGKPGRRFHVNLRVRAADTPSPLPKIPDGLNQLQGPTHQQLQAWREATDKARHSALRGAILLDKTLSVTGERAFKRTIWPLRLLITAIKWSSLGIISLKQWRLCAPKKFASLPLRYEYTFGGQCRVNAGERAAKRVGKKNRLTPTQLAAHPDSDLAHAQQAVAHSAYERNLAGRGFAEAWYLRASQCRQLPAPRIEHPAAPMTGTLFWQVQRGKFKSHNAMPKALDPVGFGVRAKAHPARRALLGAVDDAFIQSKAWLPQDFDFAIWNAAPLDQQIAHPRNDESIELANLCALNAPGARCDTQGNTILRLDLLRHECFALLRMESGEMISQPLSIDTVMIEPEQHTLTLVWRTILEKNEAAPIRVCEARMHTHADRDALQENMVQVTAMLEQAKQARQGAPARPFALHPAWGKVGK